MFLKLNATFCRSRSQQLKPNRNLQPQLSEKMVGFPRLAPSILTASEHRYLFEAT